MTLNEIMKYIESEYEIINRTPCEICGGDFLADSLQIAIIDGVPYDLCNCICSNCGYEKDFLFNAPFIDEEFHKILKKNLN